MILPRGFLLGAHSPQLPVSVLAGFRDFVFQTVLPGDTCVLGLRLSPTVSSQNTLQEHWK
jgi:hypothetical protein